MDKNDKKVLVVEDDDLLRKLMVEQLTGKYPVIAASDGEEAIKQIEAERPGMIVLDLLLPKLDGFGVLEKLRTLADSALAATPVLVVSNLNDSMNILRAKQYKVLEYYVKSDVNFGILVNRITRYFRDGT